MRANGIQNLYKECRLCPRDCGVNRLQGERGYCGETARMRIAWAGLHLGEEPPLIGEKGSGTIFFSGCTLKCGSCQNCQLSSQGMGREVSASDLESISLRLQERGAANINLVTASHFTPSMVESVARARSQGLQIPVVWNSSGYEQVATLSLLGGSVDIYLPDCKTLDSEMSRSLMGAPDYPEVAKRALLKIVADKSLVVEHEQLRQGVVMRHLVLPGLLAQSREVLHWFAANLKDRALLSLMFQYTPVAMGAARHGPHRTVSRREYQQVLAWLEELGIDDGFVQDPARNDDWIPDFTRSNPFPEGQAVPVWHYETGYLE
ncbi:MAG: 4Fe-4S cluster-binding domain-containing protein [Spirochaetaceae bacterium]|nr:MAG: 4Fe-4S cluster-binding domain-containing protein [Spirochaetaceae bacterium]